MYKIERKKAGFLLTFEGYMDKAEMDRWHTDSQKALASEEGDPFCVIVDMRNLKPLPPDAQETMVAGQQLYQKRGMNRSSVIVNNAVTASQFRRLAKDSGIYRFERYFDGSKPRFMQRAIDWGRDGTDPDS